MAGGADGFIDLPGLGSLLDLRNSTLKLTKLPLLTELLYLLLLLLKLGHHGLLIHTLREKRIIRLNGYLVVSADSWPPVDILKRPLIWHLARRRGPQKNQCCNCNAGKSFRASLLSTIH